MTLWTQEGGKLTLDFHRGQARAWRSQRRFVFVLAGTQSGKTSFLPWWLWREIKQCGEGDYLAVTATYDLFKLKFLPALRECFETALGIGKYYPSDRVLDLPSLGARVILRSAESEGGLESSTAKAAILDEAGLDSYNLQIWEAVQRRLSLSQGRVCAGTTVYDLGWLKTHIYDRWRKGDKDLEIVHFDSTENPIFPKKEFERQRASMPIWRFNMQYRGLFERPAGLIYDSFDETQHVVPRFALDPKWSRFMGLDFGGVNTAALFYAAEPGTERLFLYREYLAGGRTAKEHTDKLLQGEPMIPECVGGSKSEGQWRNEFKSAGLPVRPPDVREVELGIMRVYGAHKRGEILVFDDLHGYLDQKRSYARELDQNGEPTEKIADKETFHYLDAERYILGRLKRQHVGRGA